MYKRQNRNLKALYSPGHAKHHYSFYDEFSGTLFMGDTLRLIYPHGDFVQPNLPPPDFDKEILFKTLDSFEKLEINQLAIAHFGIHKNARELIKDAKESIENWILFISNIENLSNDDASNELLKWLIRNYESLGIDNETINNYIGNGNFEMQVIGIRNYLEKVD